MKYYLDTEFDGHNGPLLSLALVREDDLSIYIRTTARAVDPWVVANVEPLMEKHDADVVGLNVLPEDVGARLRDFLAFDDDPLIIADSVVDIGRFCAALSTGPGGCWASVDGKIAFEVHDVACYPTALPGAVQHNAWWDAMALRERLS